MLPGPGLIRVGMDARCLNRGHLRGMGKYAWELVTRGAARHRVRWSLFADDPRYPFRHPESEGIHAELFECRGDRFQAWEQFALPRRIRSAGVDVLHCPGTTLCWWQPVPTVVTLHDTIPWDGEGGGGWPSWYVRGLLPRAFARAAAVITISENSRRDILRLWGGLDEKLHVIPHGVGDRYLEAPTPRGDGPTGSVGVRGPYLLYLGGGIARKRLDWAIRVLEGLGDPRLTLVACGVARADQDGFLEATRPELRPKIHFAGFIDEAEMPALYAGAAAVLYPTLYEGFGLPVLEAQAVGTPILFSALGSLGELAGPASVLLPPYDLDAWVGACRALIESRGEGPQPDERARAWARQFSWDTCVDRHMEVYRAVAAPARIGRGEKAAV